MDVLAEVDCVERREERGERKGRRERGKRKRETESKRKESERKESDLVYAR